MKDANSIYQKLIKRQKKNSLNPTAEKFKSFSEIEKDLKDKFHGIGAYLTLTVDPSADHTIALLIEVEVESSEIAEHVRQLIAELFDEKIIYNIGTLPMMYSDGYEVVYRIMADNYYYKPQLGRDY